MIDETLESVVGCTMKGSHDDLRFRNRIGNGLVRKNFAAVDVNFVLDDHVFAEHCDIFQPHLLMYEQTFKTKES